MLGATMLTAAVGAGCNGNIGEASPDGRGGPGSEDDGLIDASSAGMRRMTPEQFQNTMRDLFGDPGIVLDLDPDEGQVVALLTVDKLRAAAEQIVSRRASWTKEIFPCDTTGAEDAACVESFIRNFGRRAFRHTLAEDEVDLLKKQFETVRQEQSFDQAMLLLVETMIQSPEVYYFLELGDDPGDNAFIASGVRPLTGWERASRLSYFLWQSAPDDALLDAAEAGKLDTIEGVRAQAERLASDDRAREAVVSVFVDWLELDGTHKHGALEDVPKSADLYPEDSSELRSAMRTETRALVERVLFEGDGRLETLLTSTDAYVNASLAEIYGVDGPADDETFAWVTLPADQRAGLFTRAAFLTLFGGIEVKSPIRRGAHILREVLCTELGPPPPNASDVPIKGGATEGGVNKTVRQDVDAKTLSGNCVACHRMINPIGFAFEHYDSMGRWVSQESGDGPAGPFTLDIDASGVLPAYGDDGAPAQGVAVDGGVEMSKALAESEKVQACITQHFFRSALRRVPVDGDLASIDTAATAAQSGGTMRDVVLALATSNAFLHARLPE